MSDSFVYVIFHFGRDVRRLSLGQYQSNQNNDQVLINTNVLNRIVNFLGQRLNNAVVAVGNHDIAQILCSVLEHAFHVISLFNNNGQFRENLVVMIIDGALTFGDNPLAASQAFNKRGITLAVVAHMTPVFPIWNDYRTLAENTGGAYMLLADAPAILKGVILSVINGEDTLRQAFQHIRPANVSTVVNPIDDINEQERPVDGVGDLVFDHVLSK